ncbi:uncharacterized protein [Amphiura filiformis]|uniref:uncharacterized protein n=1 Tax=Amphiura filiformis TaxID=82378 RepID=UPI003B213F1C
MANDATKLDCPNFTTLFMRMPSMREKRASLGQISGSIALHDAVSKGKDHLARFILDAVDGQEMVNTRDQHGKTSLIRSIQIPDEASQHKVVRMLLKHGANVNLKDNVGRTALSYACELKCNDVIKELVKNNVDPNLEDNNGNTPLVYCAQVGNHEAVTILAKCFRRLGLEVDKYNADGMTALTIAAKNGHLECARVLVNQAKASVYRRDTVRNMTSLDWAREGGCKSPEMELLLPKRLTRDRPKQTQHISLDKYQETFDASTGKEFNKALSCDSYLPDLVAGSGRSTPSESSPSFFQRRKLKQNFEKLSQRLHSRTLMRTSNSLSKLDHHRPLSASNLMKEVSLSEELDTDFDTSRSFDSALEDNELGKSNSSSSLSPHPPSGLKRSFLSRSHETISQTMFSRDEQSSVKSAKMFK